MRQARGRLRILLLLLLCILSDQDNEPIEIDEPPSEEITKGVFSLQLHFSLVYSFCGQKKQTTKTGGFFIISHVELKPYRTCISFDHIRKDIYHCQSLDRC